MYWWLACACTVVNAGDSA